MQHCATTKVSWAFTGAMQYFVRKTVQLTMMAYLTTLHAVYLFARLQAVKAIDLTGIVDRW